MTEDNSPSHRRRSELTDVQIAWFKVVRAQIPEHPEAARTYLAGVVANWNLPHSGRGDRQNRA